MRNSQLPLRALAFGLLVFTLACSSHAPFHRERGTWSAPVEFDVLPAGVSLRSIEIVVGTHGTLYVGSLIQDTLTLDHPGVNGIPGLLLHHARWGRIAPPSGAFHFLYPQIVTDASGRVHLFWAEPYSHATSSMPDGQDTGRLWYSRYSHRLGWTEPVQLVEAPDSLTPINWQEGVARPAVGADQRVHLVVTRFAMDSIIHFAVTDQRVDTTYSPIPPVLPYTALAITGSDTLHVAVIGIDTLSRASPGYGNTVHLLRSLDGGATWSPARVVAESVDGMATRVSVLAGRRGEAHLIYAYHPAMEFVTTRVHHIASPDGGASWTSVEELDAGYGFHRLRSVIDRCGTIHTFIEALPWEDPPQVLRYARFREGWSDPEILFRGVTAVRPAIAMDADGILHLLFATDFELDTGFFKGLKATRLDPAC